jgi:uncharacterized protein (DUF1684 family)
MLYVLIGLLVLGTTMLSAQEIPAGYRSQIEQWQRHREAGLRSPTGWLSLAGLFWLKQGDSSIGSGVTSDFLLPNDAPSQVGLFEVSGNDVTFTNLAGELLTINGKPVHGRVMLKHSEDDDKSDQIQIGPVLFYVIDRDGRMAVRVKDANSPTLKEFKGTQFFPINPAFRFEAKFTPAPEKIAIPDILGQTRMQDSPGIVEFQYEGHTYKLRPVYEDKTLFFVFKDLTSRKETYQPGRMVNTPLPQGGKVVLDFNKAYNPPCAFTPYATCPLPPKENVLPIRIEAGELRYTGAHTD